LNGDTHKVGETVREKEETIEKGRSNTRRKRKVHMLTRETAQRRPLRKGRMWFCVDLSA